MTARYLVGDVFDHLRRIPDGSVDLVLTSPPFLRLRSYLPDDHPDKALEIGSEETPADYLETLLRLTAELARVIAPHASLCVELGDTYAGSGGAGGDYLPGGLRQGQPAFAGSGAKYRRRPDAASGGRHPLPDRFRGGGPGGQGWPLPKSLCGIPTLYAWSLAYGVNLLTHEPSPAGRWRVRSLKPWIRTNPPVGSLGDKERPATTFITVATRSDRRYFDLEAVTTGANVPDDSGSGGSPPRDWWHHVDAVLDAALAEARQVRGWHLRRALEAAGILTTVDALDVSPKGYRGAHYAVWPEALVLLLLDEMCPRRVCTACGEPSRRLVGEATTGWSDCGHASWRPGLVLDCFAGSGTTLAVAVGTGRDTIGIDLNPANAELARERVGLFLQTSPAPARGTL